MADGTRVVEPLPGAYLDNINSEITTIDSVEKDFDGVTRKQQRIVVAAPEQNVVWDETVGVQPGATVTVVTLVGGPRLRLLGFSATGTGDARFRLLVSGQPILGGHTNISQPCVERALMTEVLLPTGTSATVEVLCRGASVSDYEATIYAEVTDG